MKSTCLILLTGLGLVGPGVVPSGWSQGGSTAGGVSNTMNPAISVNGLFRGEWRDPAAESDGLKAQEIEFALTSVVDPYFKANVYFAYEPDPAGPEAETAIEEAYVVTTSLPAGLGIRAGRMFAPIGRHNQLHAHAYPFIDAPLAVRSILGPESAGDVGVEAAYAPDTPWYLNLRVFGGDGAAEGVFDGESRDLAGGARIENLWDLSEGTSLEAAVSVWDGPGTEEPRRTLSGADVRLKYRDPRRAQGRIWEWVTEVLLDSGTASDPRGAYTFLRTRTARRWWLGAGYSTVSLIPEGSEDRTTEQEVRGQVAFIPSEFSALRADLFWMDPSTGDSIFGLAVQLNFTIGSHPAHAY